MQKRDAEYTDLVDLYGADGSILLPTLFDLLVHAAPDEVMGDGGSLYIRLDVPPSEGDSACPGCHHGEELQRQGRPCDQRAYLVATTRDHPRVPIGRNYYCTNPEVYREAGSCISKVLVHPLIKLGAEVARTAFRTMRDVRRRSASEPPDGNGRFLDRALALFEEMFCATANDAPSAMTASVRRALSLTETPAEPATPAAQKKRTHDEDAKAYLDLVSRSQDSDRGSAGTDGCGAAADRCGVVIDGGTGTDGGEAVLGEASRRSMATLFRCSAALAREAIRDRRSRAYDSGGPRHREEVTGNISTIAWELLQRHELLRDHLRGYQNGLSSIRIRFPALGLSGWSAAFHQPIRLRNVENPFEIDAITKMKNRARRTRPELPMPLWGDRARGHQDRLEREGRPFLVQPIRGGGEPGEAPGVGFLRIATKRECERRFTEEDEETLREYVRRVSGLLREAFGDPPSLPAGRRGQLGRWWGLVTYGAVKGQSLAQLGMTAAQAFRESVSATTASVFLREDLWLPQEAFAASKPAVGVGSPTGSAEQKGRRYVLWGTHIDPRFLNDPDTGEETRASRRAKFGAFRESRGKEGLGVST